MINETREAAAKDPHSNMDKYESELLNNMKNVKSKNSGLQSNFVFRKRCLRFIRPKRAWVWLPKQTANLTCLCFFDIMKTYFEFHSTWPRWKMVGWSLAFTATAEICPTSRCGAQLFTFTGCGTSLD